MFNTQMQSSFLFFRHLDVAKCYMLFSILACCLVFLAYGLFGNDVRERINEDERIIIALEKRFDADKLLAARARGLFKPNYVNGRVRGRLFVMNILNSISLMLVWHIIHMCVFALAPTFHEDLCVNGLAERFESMRHRIDVYPTLAAANDEISEFLHLRPSPTPPSVTVSTFENYVNDSDVSGDGLWRTGVSYKAWSVHSGSTPSLWTGPRTAAVGSYYAYCETSWPNYRADPVPYFDLSTRYISEGVRDITFYYMMYGEYVGPLQVE